MRIGMFAVVAILAVAAPARAQPSTTQKADELFNQGRDLLEAGKFKEACAKFEASLLQADALGTRLNLALCMEKRGKLHTAVVKFDDTAARADHEGVPESAKVAREHADKLRPLVPKLVIQTTPVPGQRVAISRPGEADRDVTWDAPIPIDPTDPSDRADVVRVIASAPGYVAHTSEPQTIAAKATVTVVIPPLTQLLDPDPRPVAPAGKSHRKLFGIISATAGAGLVLGSTLWARSLGQDLTARCNDAATAMECERDGSGGFKSFSGEAADIKFKQRWYATSMFVVGLGGIGFGAYLFFTAPAHPETATAVVPTVGSDGGGIAVRGHF